MQINSQTPQAVLERLYHAVTRRELLQESPLNVRRSLRFALLFLMFPGMICGFWVGLGLTLAFCVALICLLGMEHTPEAVLATQLWLVCGGCVFVFFSAVSVCSALAVRRRRETPRPAEADGAGELATLACAEVQKLRWHKRVNEAGAQEWVAELRFYAPAPGIHALLFSMPKMKRQQILTGGKQGVCTVHTSMSGAQMQSLLLYKLAAGQHTLRWTLAPCSGSAPPAEVTLLCRP